METEKPKYLQRKTPLRRTPLKRSQKEIKRSPLKPGKGTKGDAPSAAQKRFHDALCRHVGCIACRIEHDIVNTHVSVHHINGRKKAAHWLVLPLCGPHHQGDGTQDIVSVHPWKARFEERFGSQLDLLEQCKTLLREYGFTGPVAAEGCDA